MKAILGHCVGYKIGWRRVFLMGAILIIAGVAFQAATLPSYSTRTLFITPNAEVHSYESLKSIMPLTEILTEARDENFQVVPNITHVLSLNSSNERIQLALDIPERDTASQRRKPISKGRKGNIKLDNKPQVTSPHLPSRTRVSSRLQRNILSMSPNEALVYAKKEIAHAPPTVIDDDADLYAPLFHNVSTFKRSYELMEIILKVYIYRDGKRPIFHTPHLKGIYASEGWFMKLMEESKQFATKDPEKAHLFYLPYSARQLQMKLYVPDSHDMKPLAIFLKDYVNMISSKYPFWNRTHGSDHFLVACHDWGPYTLKEHKELSKNTIKALCNADLSEGYFVSGRDVSLPETTIRTPKRPVRSVGGNRVSQRSILAFFAGNMHGRVRPVLLKHWKDKDDDMKIYGLLPLRVSRKMSYIQHMKSSKYCICPMGYEVNSPRIIESIYYECVPVIIADNFALPFSEVLNWNEFSVIVAEKDIPKLKDILSEIPLRRYLKMQINVKMVQKHFFWKQKPVRYDLFHMVLHSIWLRRLNQIQIPET